MTPRLPLLALAFLASLPLACSETRSPSAQVDLHGPFSALSYTEALDKAKADERVVLLDFTAGWCPPCRAMEETTWPDADVQAWVAREAVAIQVDVDREGDLAAKFRASSIPTIVFVEPSGRELGRFVGYKDPAQFLAEAAKHVD